MNFDIFVVGGIDIYKMVFDAIVGIMGSGMVGSVARIFALVGLLMVMFEVAFKGKAQNFLRYAITVALISGVIMVPKATVVIQDRLAPMSPRTVANVPLVVAFAASVTSRVGDRALTIFEQWFATPSAQSYANGGVVFGARLLGDYVQASPPARGQA
ncbi:MAG: conjugal transfer protein TraG N-terminal domain-containing protein, partial [Usitatibacteraceae bacterium]